jgi:hypothetical protein
VARSHMVMTGSGDPVRRTLHALSHHFDFVPISKIARVFDPVGTTISAALEIGRIAGREV